MKNACIPCRHSLDSGEKYFRVHCPTAAYRVTVSDMLEWTRNRYAPLSYLRNHVLQSTVHFYFSVHLSLSKRGHCEGHTGAKCNSAGMVSCDRNRKPKNYIQGGEAWLSSAVAN